MTEEGSRRGDTIGVDDEGYRYDGTFGGFDSGDDLQFEELSSP
jgi:hypothetical protein